MVRGAGSGNDIGQRRRRIIRFGSQPRETLLWTSRAAGEALQRSMRSGSDVAFWDEADRLPDALV